MKESLLNIGDIIAEPSAAFSRLKLQPRSGLAFCVFFFVSILLGWVLLPYSQGLISAQIATSSPMAPEQREAAENIAGIMKGVGVFLGPLFVVLWFVVGSALLSLVARFSLKRETLRFGHIYAAIVHIALISCIIQLVNTALLFVFKDVETVTRAVDFKMIPGVHMLLGSGANPKLEMFLSHINPLSVWVIAVIAIALAVLAGMEKNRARVAAVILWVLSLLPEVLSAT